MPRQGHETGVGINADREIDTSILVNSDGHRLGPGCARQITRAEEAELRRSGRLRCPGPQNDEGHQLVKDQEPGEHFAPVTAPRVEGDRVFASESPDAPEIWPPCGNFLLDMSKSRSGSKPALRPELYCPACNFSIRLFTL